MYGMATAVALFLLYGFYLQTHEVEVQHKEQLAVILPRSEERQGQSAQLDVPTQYADCQASGPLPDHECTPGAIFTQTSPEEICTHGYSKTVRNVSQSQKRKIFAMYDIKYPVPFGSYEIDHLIPLSLGGSNEVSNLWPKAAEPFPGFFEKNITGNYLREEVCAGRISLAAAQEQMAKDWFFIYQHIDHRHVEELKLKYPNWANRRN